MQSEADENHLVGIGWMLLTMVLFVTMDAMVKLLIQEHSALQIVWARFFFHMMWMTVFLRKAILATFSSGNYKLQLLRSAFLVMTTALFFSGLRTTELPTATAIMFMSPVFVTLLAIPMLGESVGIRRLSGVLIGFLGAIIIVHPRSEPIGLESISTHSIVDSKLADQASIWWPETGHLMIIAAAVSNAMYQIMTRKVRTVDSASTSLLYSGVVGTLVMSCVAPTVWQTPAPVDWLFMLCVGLVGCVSHFCLIRAFRNAPASLVVPFSYTSLLWATLLGFLLFNALPDRWTLMGAAFIIASGLYIFYRERVVSNSASD